ncbi:hypothetical protein D3C75_1332170 [compost metagenome]
MRILKHAAKIRKGNQTIEESVELFRSLHEDPTLNSWQHLYYRAVLDNPEMLEYLATGILPAKIE